LALTPQVLRGFWDRHVRRRGEILLPVGEPGKDDLRSPLRDSFDELGGNRDVHRSSR
jgi:hypothetical protein